MNGANGNAKPPAPIRWINQLSMPSVAALVMQVVWIYGSIRFTGVAANMLLREGAQSEIHHSYGFQLAVALLVAWTGGKVTNALSNFGVRKTAKEYVEAKHKGDVAGAAAAVVIAEQAKDAQAARDALTGERPAKQQQPLRNLDDERGTI
jgi:hypothetical protein